MIGYYCISPHGRTFFYVPCVMLIYSCNRTDDVIVRYEPETINRLALETSCERLTRKRLEDKLWDVYDVEIPDSMVKRFIGLCQTNKNKRKTLKKAIEILDYIENHNDFEDGLFGFKFEDDEKCNHVSDNYEELLSNVDSKEYDPNEPEYNGHFNEDDVDEEDYQDQWWSRGEPPPQFDLYMDD